MPQEGIKTSVSVKVTDAPKKKELQEEEKDEPEA